MTIRHVFPQCRPLATHSRKNYICTYYFVHVYLNLIVLEWNEQHRKAAVGDDHRRTGNK